MKLPQGYVPGSGVHKATAYGGFGQRMLEKQGWQKGQGLGKERSGIASALEVKEKKDTLGVGANGGWDWSHRFWEEAYNSAVQDIGGKKKQEASSSSSSSSSDDSDSDSDSGAALKPGQRRVPARKQAASPKQQQDQQQRKRRSRGASSSDSSSSSSSSDDSDADDADGKKQAAARALAHRDGTAAHSATLAELTIAAELAKDPWGRWGGRGGKMARIRQQEAEEAARARQLLVNSAALHGAAPPAAAAKQQAGGAGKAPHGGSASSSDTAAAAPPPKKRIVVTLRLRAEQRVQRKAFVPTPATGWWGSGYFTSAGCLEGMESEEEREAGEEGKAERGASGRKTFNEDDQANLYMLVHQNQRVGHKGLGRSTTVNVAGGKWEGTKKTFDDDEQQQQQQGAGGEAAAGPSGRQGQAKQAAGEAREQGEGAAQIREKRKKQKRRAEEVAVEAEAPAEPAAQREEGGGSKRKKSKKQKREEQSEGEGQQQQRQAGSSDRQQKEPVEAPGEDAAPAGKSGPVKWIKVAKLLLKKAPERRLKLEKLCKRMLEHPDAQPGLHKTMSHEKLSSLLHRKAKQRKVIIEGGYVSLAQA